MMTTRRQDRRSLSPRKASSKSPGRTRALNSRSRASAPLILPPPSSLEVTSGDDESQYSGDPQSEIECAQKLKEYCKLFQITASDSMIFRFACFYDWDYEETRKALKKDFSSLYLNIPMDDSMVTQFQKNIMFPLPKLKTKTGKSQVIYVRPVRYVRSSEAFDEFLKQLCFILNDLSRTAQQCRHGVSFLVNLKGFCRRNADLENSTRLVQMIQDHLVPTKVEMVIFVDTTSMSSKLWQSISPLLSTKEQNKVFFTKQDELYRFLMPSFEKFLPDEIAEGWRNATDLIDGYVQRKIKMEKEEKEQ